MWCYLKTLSVKWSINTPFQQWSQPVIHVQPRQCQGQVATVNLAKWALVKQAVLNNQAMAQIAQVLLIGVALAIAVLMAAVMTMTNVAIRRSVQGLRKHRMIVVVLLTVVLIAAMTI